MTSSFTEVNFLTIIRNISGTYSCKYAFLPAEKAPPHACFSSLSIRLVLFKLDNFGHISGNFGHVHLPYKIILGAVQDMRPISGKRDQF